LIIRVYRVSIRAQVKFQVFMKLVNVEPKENYILRDDPGLFKSVRFKNTRIFWNDQFDFHLDQILALGEFVLVGTATR
jgi:hypothetical protein